MISARCLLMLSVVAAATGVPSAEPSEYCLGWNVDGLRLGMTPDEMLEIGVTVRLPPRPPHPSRLRRAGCSKRCCARKMPDFIAGVSARSADDEWKAQLNFKKGHVSRAKLTLKNAPFEAIVESMTERLGKPTAAKKGVEFQSLSCNAHITVRRAPRGPVVTMKRVYSVDYSEEPGERFKLPTPRSPYDS